MTQVEPGSVWADNSRKGRGRTIRVDEVAAQYAYCTTLTNRATGIRNQVGQHTRVLLHAFHDGPALTGYSRLEASGGTAGRP